MNKSYSLIRKEIMSWAVSGPVRQEDISVSTGVSQSQVSKILSGRFKAVSPNVKKICKYANIQIHSNAGVDIPEELKEAILDLWDGSRESEKALVKTLRTMKGLLGNSCVNN